MTHFVKAVTKPVVKLIDHIPGASIIAPAVLTAIGQPELAAAFSGVNNLDNGGSLGSSLLSAGLSYGGAALGGSDTAFGDTFSGPISSGLSSIGDSLSNAGSGALNSLGLNSLYDNASGALGDAYNSASDALGSAYNGSGIQDAFDSGKSALQSVGLGGNTSSNPVGASAVGGGGGDSSYGDNLLGNSNLNIPQSSGSSYFNSSPSATSLTSNLAPASGSSGNLLDNLSSPTSLASGNAGTYFKDLNNPTSTLSSTGAPNVATASTNYFSPLASLGIGTLSNNSATNALLDATKRSQALLAPYSNGFSFSPGDLTQDPGYQFNLQQGNQALDRKQSASGNYFSGAALKDAQTFGQGLADNTYNTAYNRALQGFNTGLSGAADAAQLSNNVGTIKSQGITNEGNLASGALGNILGGNSFTNSGALTGSVDTSAILKKLLGLQ